MRPWPGDSALWLSESRTSAPISLSAAAAPIPLLAAPMTLVRIPVNGFGYAIGLHVTCSSFMFLARAVRAIRRVRLQSKTGLRPLFQASRLLQNGDAAGSAETLD